MNLLVTNVPWGIGSSSKTLRLQSLQFLNVGISGGSPNRARVVHHRTNELLIKQNAILDREAASPVQERTQYSQSLSSLLSHLIDMFRPGEPSVEGHPKITGGIGPFDGLPEKSKRTELGDKPSSLNEEH
jgi:hypothetical protein